MAKVFLLAHTPSPEKTVAAAAKLCYSSSDIEGLNDSLTDEKAAAFVEMLSEIGHESPIEHASFTFGIEGVSRSLLAQITRHRKNSSDMTGQTARVTRAFRSSRQAERCMTMQIARQRELWPMQSRYLLKD